MATVTSRLPALLDYLVALFTSAATLGAANPPVVIFDGRTITERDALLKLYVGVTDPDVTGYDPAGDSVQEWGAIGRFGRNEMITIRCCAEAWQGSAGAIQAVRVSAYGIVAAVEALMQADTTQFGGNVLFPDPGITNQALTQNNTSQGAFARVAFDLIFKARIGGF